MKLTLEQRRAVLKEAMQTPEGQEVLKMTLRATMAEEFAEPLCDAIDNGPEGVVNKIIDRVLDSFNAGRITLDVAKELVAELHRFAEEKNETV